MTDLKKVSWLLPSDVCHWLYSCRYQ